LGARKTSATPAALLLLASALPGILGSCAIQRAETARSAKEQMIGLSNEKVLACMGPPADRLRQRRSSAAGAPNLRGRGIARLQVLQASIDRAARYPCRPRHHGHAAISGRPRLRGSEQPPASFVEARARRFETAANRCLVNHALVIDCAAETGNPPTTFRRRSPPAPVDSLILRRRLNLYNCSPTPLNL
jgi:hypothetical protein